TVALSFAGLTSANWCAKPKVNGSACGADDDKASVISQVRVSPTANGAVPRGMAATYQFINCAGPVTPSATDITNPVQFTEACAKSNWLVKAELSRISVSTGCGPRLAAVTVSV